MADAKNINFQKDKMKHVILYFLEHINNFHLGKTKLMKLLYYVDFNNVEKYGAPITCAKYRKLPLGPVPDEAEDVIAEMVKSGDVESLETVITSNGKPKYKQQRLLPVNAKFNPALFSGPEIETLECVAKIWEDATAAQMKDASHKEAPWAATEHGKAIDYEMAHYRGSVGDCDEVDAMLAESEPFSKFVSSLK
jgi:uncharacterized phage-associated protein